MCGNRFLQITILILILIMAFCLVAITTLYIMERHKDKKEQAQPVYQNTPPPFLHSTHPTRASSIVSGGNASSRVQPPSPETDTSSTTTPSPAPTTPSTLPNSSSTTTTKGPDLKTTMSVWDESTVVTPRPTLPAYPTPTCQKGECEELCCPPPPEDQPIVSGGGEPVYHIDNMSGGGTGEIGGGGGRKPPIDTTASQNRNTVVSMGMNIASSSNNNNNNNNHHMSNRIPNHNKNNIQVVISNSGPPYNIANDINHNKVHRVFRRQAEMSGADIQIVVRELNVTIDRHYCRAGCHGNNQSYFILMAPLFGYEPITLEFRMNKSRHVALCRAQPIAACPGAHISVPELQIKNGTSVQWSLGVGVYFKNIYVFRVTEGQGIPNDNVNELCTLQPTAGLMIKDYRLQFQRSCSD